MNDAIPDRSNGNRSSLAVRDFEKTISARRIQAAIQLVMQTKEILFEKILERDNFLAAFLSSSEKKPALPNIL